MVPSILGWQTPPLSRCRAGETSEDDRASVAPLDAAFHYEGPQQALVRELGPEKVLYGFDWNRPAAKTYGLKWLRSQYQQWYSLNTIALADITEDERDLILYKNAQRLLKLN